MRRELAQLQEEQQALQLRSERPLGRKTVFSGDQWGFFFSFFGFLVLQKIMVILKDFLFNYLFFFGLQ